MERNENIYYVYGLIDPRNNEVFYIGKGKGKRVFQHFSEEFTEEQGNRSKIKRIKEIQDTLGKNPEVKFFCENLIEEAAYALEEILIDKIGREILGYGPLTNWLVGGQKEDRYKMSIEENEKTTVEIVKEKYPEILAVVESIPRTTREDNIKREWAKAISSVLTILNSYDDKILDDIKAEEIKYLDRHKGISIQFECEYGLVYITYVDDYMFESNKKGKSSLHIYKNGEDILAYRRILHCEVTQKLREFHEKQNG